MTCCNAKQNRAPGIINRGTQGQRSGLHKITVQSLRACETESGTSLRHPNPMPGLSQVTQSGSHAPSEAPGTSQHQPRSGLRHTTRQPIKMQCGSAIPGTRHPSSSSFKTRTKPQSVTQQCKRTCEVTGTGHHH